MSHDLLEGIVPYELASCIGIFIDKHYVQNITEVNKMVFQYTDSVNRPQLISASAVVKKNIGEMLLKIAHFCACFH